MFSVIYTPPPPKIFSSYSVCSTLFNALPTHKVKALAFFLKLISISSWSYAPYNTLTAMRYDVNIMLIIIIHCHSKKI